jgi:PST family polysaccharide transporter
MAVSMPPSTGTTEPVLQHNADTVARDHKKRGTYGEIFKSTVLIGGSTALNVGIGIVRTKAMAVLLGPAGFGMMGLFTSITDLVRSVAGMGVNSSGVRQIAEAVGSGDEQRVARTVVVLRRTAIFLALFGTLLMVLFARAISTVTFGTDAHAGAVALLSVAVFLRMVSDGQGALIQGMRRISDLARISVFGALLGTAASIPILYFLRQDGVVPALVAVAAMSAGMSWWYSRRVPILPCVLSASEVRQEAALLLKLGLAFMASTMLMMAAAYGVRLIVLRHAGLDEAGFYQAAWTLGGLYVGFVLQAMGADFYPRLVGVVNHRAEMNRLVNEQAQVSLLLAGPGVVATLTFAPLVIAAFYSREFAAAVDVLRWICLGMALRVMAWPVGYVVVAMNRQAIFFGTELAWTLVNVGLSWACVRAFGLAGAGMAFFASYVLHAVLVYAIARRLSGFHCSAALLKTGLLFVLSVAAAFIGFHVLAPLWALFAGTVIFLASTCHAVRVSVTLAPPELLPPLLRRLRARATPARVHSPGTSKGS